MLAWALQALKTPNKSASFVYVLSTRFGYYRHNKSNVVGPTLQTPVHRKGDFRDRCLFFISQLILPQGVIIHFENQRLPANMQALSMRVEYSRGNKLKHGLGPRERLCSSRKGASAAISALFFAYQGVQLCHPL